ncbi:DEAD/DEAH box helicase [Shewanella spartinae]|uniref:DEAD/DEAH box helicase n=1 Tax=Shewanella spartinae TaxID=2864205 RepID=UPI001C6565A5|nr:DEAD/DEAH box helicase family protein [Shewanella spartinae]QYJ94270.1 DEAD/DEAH box helicase family protein [Shewanella spartinae]
MRVSGFTIDDVLWAELRKCQKGSIKTALSYVRRPLNAEAKSCLISLPTGAGKSGVISVICHKATQKKVLVLCHRRAVCNQLLDDINGKFFNERAEGEDIPLKPAFSIVDDTSANGVYVSTFQKLQTFTQAQLDELKQNIELVIIDEGHAEPSPVWRNLVRNIEAHKIVITATPYRNDLFQFDIDANASYIYTFEKALEDGVLKEPQFETIQADELSASIRHFLNNNPGAKCIIKANKFSDVEHYYALLNEQFNLLAIHEQFTADPRENAKSSVPSNLNSSNYEVIIHQRKLDEGVDIPQAKLLVLTYAVSSGRELVQTIGRVVRLFGEVDPKVLELGQNANEQMWRNYRIFDSSISDDSAAKKFISSLDVNRLIELYLEAFPDASYYGNRFLSKFDLNTFNPEASLNIPTASVCFLNQSRNFNIEVMLDALYWRCNNAGELARKIDTDYGIKVIVSIAFNRSKFLADKFFFEPSLEITLFKEIAQNIVAIYDSRGRRFNGDKDLNLGSAVTQDQLLKVMSRGVSVKTKETSSKSVSSARRRPESVAVKGPNLEDMSDLQSNAAYRLATLRCDTYNQFDQKSGSYYVGVDSGRISDQKESSFSLRDLNDWLEGMEAMILGNPAITSGLVHSFAKPIPVNVDLGIESLIFDFSEFEQPISILVDGERFILENEFIYRQYDDGCLLNAEVERSKVKATLQAEEPFLVLTTDEQILYSLEDGVEPNLDLVELLTKYLHKALLENGVGYSQGKFFELKLPVENDFDIANSQLANVVVGMDTLVGANLDEKGLNNGVYQVINQEFSANSIFYLLDQIKSNALDNPTLRQLGPFNQYIPAADLVLNTDMGTEPADFILSSPEKLVYVHVKCGSSQNPQSSAGALAEVGSQAIKNIEMLISGNSNLTAANWNRLLGPWPQNGAAQQMHERIRMFKGERFQAANNNEREAMTEEVWDIIAQRRRSSRVHKEVWIVAANSFSASHFETQLTRGHNALSESLQAYQLIQSWLSTANSNDVDLKIFVSP